MNGMVDGVQQAMSLLGLAGQSTAPQAPISRKMPADSVQSNFRSMLDYQLEQADLETERREGASGWNSTFGAEGTPAPDPDNLSEKEKAHKAATGLESILVSTLLKQMWASVDEGTLFGQSMGSQFYREMWLDEVSKDIAENQSLGIAAVIEKELVENIERTVTVEELAERDKTAQAAGIALHPQEENPGLALDPMESSGFPLSL